MTGLAISGLVTKQEPLLVQIYNDTKKAGSRGWHMVKRFNQNRQVVKLINLMRATEATTTKTIAFQADGLSAPLGLKIIGPANCSRNAVLSWSKTERILALRDAKVCQEANVPLGTLTEARELVLSSRDAIKDDFMCVISRAFGWGALDSSLDNTKTEALRQKLGGHVQGIYAGDLSLCELFYETSDDVPLDNHALRGDEIPIGFATTGEADTTVLLLSDSVVILLHNDKMFKKHQNFSHKRSINSLVTVRKPLSKTMAQFIYRASAAFSSESRTVSAASYLTSVRFVQKFLSLATDNLSRPSDDDEVSRTAGKALMRDAARLDYITKACFAPPGYEESIELSSREMRDVHGAQGELSTQQRSRIFHDLSWQDKIYNEASADAFQNTDALAGTLSDDDNREQTLTQLFSTHKTCIRMQKTLEASEGDSLKLNLAVMCYNRLTKNAYATVGFENVLRKHKTAVVSSDLYKAIYTPHSEAAVLYFFEDCFSDLDIKKYQPNKGRQESVLGLLAVLHDQLDVEGKSLVDRKVYDKLQGGLHNITVAQDEMMKAMTENPQIRDNMELKVSNLYISIANYTEDVKVRRWLEREVLGFLAYHGVPNKNVSLGFSSMYSAFCGYYQTAVDGLEVIIDRPGNLDNTQIRISSKDGSYLMCEKEFDHVFKVRKKDGKEIKRVEDLKGMLQLVCRPGSEPQEDWIDVYLERQDVFG